MRSLWARDVSEDLAGRDYGRIRDDKILLARGRNYANKEMFSVLAGFLEAGESLEEAVMREIMEEVAIEVANVRYFKSQPWPFPDSLMIAFTAEYKSGEIKIDENEIIEARWFKAGQREVSEVERNFHRFPSHQQARMI